MAARLIWSTEALDDIDALAEYINRDSPSHARRVVEELFAIADTILDQPRQGRVVPELGDDKLRERFLYSYRLIYELHQGDVHVLAVIHGRRLLDSVEERLT